MSAEAGPSRNLQVRQSHIGGLTRRCTQHRSQKNKEQVSKLTQTNLIISLRTVSSSLMLEQCESGWGSDLVRWRAAASAGSQACLRGSVAGCVECLSWKTSDSPQQRSAKVVEEWPEANRSSDMLSLSSCWQSICSDSLENRVLRRASTGDWPQA